VIVRSKFDGVPAAIAFYTECFGFASEWKAFPAVV